MENPTLVKKAWRRWVALPIDRRSEVSASLGFVGRVLNIAANVDVFLNHSPPVPPSDEDDVIDAEFEERP